MRRVGGRLAAALVVVLVGGCGDAERPRAAASAPTATATPTATAAPVPAREVRFRASDGRPVQGEFAAPGRGSPAVVLLHELNGGPAQFADFVPALHAAGFATLAYESRPDISEVDRVPDLSGAIRWLRGRREVDPERIGAVGASIGASTVVVAISGPERRRLRAAVALSPPDSPDVFALQDGGRYRPHDVLFASDEREASAVENALDGAVRSDSLVAPESGHGVQLLPLPPVRDAVLDWLGERVAG